MLILGVMVLLTVFFSILSYNDTIEGHRQNELNRLKAIVKTQALFLENPNFIDEEKVSTDLSSPIFINKLQHCLTNTSRINDLEQGLCLLLIGQDDKPEEIITTAGSVNLRELSSRVQAVLANLPAAPISSEAGHSSDSDVLFYVYPISFPGSKEYRGYLYAEENIATALRSARIVLLKRFGVAFLFIIFLGFAGKRFLNRILRHEVLAKQKLKDYSAIVDERNKELERLSFVLEKSENLILLTNQYGKIEWLNQKAKSANNYTVEELKTFIGRDLTEISHYPKIKEAIETVNRTKEKHIYQAKSYDKGKREFWASTTITPILNKDGEVVNLLFVDADITKLKMAEKEISKLANFAQENTSALMRFAVSGEVLYANEPGTKLLHQWGTQVNGYLQKPSILKTIRMSFDLEEEQQLNLESNNRIFSLRFIPVYQKGYVNVSAEDITEVKLAEKEYRERASMIEKHNLNITDSINYAKRIQDAIIPGEDHLRKVFQDSFLIYRPKDIVSGDFVWLYEIKPREEYLLALADCTGHGVPGAMMSIIGHSLLNEIVDGGEVTDPAKILEELNREVIKTLRQKSESESSDGMDVSIVKINIPELTMTFAGAYLDMYWMNGKLNVFKGDRVPIGGKHHDFERKFNNRTFKISKGDSIFLASDGFVDQFGGPEDKKFLRKRFSELLKSNYSYSMQAQSFIYEKTFEEWKGCNEQIDDVSFIGIKF